MMKPLAYPFQPKSTALLVPGQFWPIELKSGRFACGRVLQVADRYGKRHSRMFFGGLMDWTDDAPPTSERLAGRRLGRVDQMHIKTITHSGAEIAGCRELAKDGIVLPAMLSGSPEDPNCALVCGLDIVGLPSGEQRTPLETISTWGSGVLNILAEERFGTSTS